MSTWRRGRAGAGPHRASYSQGSGEAPSKHPAPWPMALRVGISFSFTSTGFSSPSSLSFFLGQKPREIYNQPLSADTRGEKVLSSLC